MKEFLIFLIIFWPASSSAENETLSASFSNPGKDPLPPSYLGEYCLDKICPENQFCNDLWICQCCQGFKSNNEYCVPCSGENEKCEKTEDCCERLICIKGFCRKPKTNIEFITLAKISLAITATTITIAVLTFLLKCLIRYGRFQRFRREDDTVSLISIHSYMCRYRRGNYQPPSYEAELEKPPSYEDCIRGSPGIPFNEPPPPYIISSNVPRTTGGFNRRQPEEMIPVNQQNLVSTPLNVQALENSTNQSIQENQSKRNNLKEKEMSP